MGRIEGSVEDGGSDIGEAIVSEEVGERRDREGGALGLFEVEAVVCGEVMIDVINIVNPSPFGGRVAGIVTLVDWYLKIVEVAILARVDVCSDSLKDTATSFGVKYAFDG